jgi:hypothetical protein
MENLLRRTVHLLAGIAQTACRVRDSAHLLAVPDTTITYTPVVNRAEARHVEFLGLQQ